MPLGFLEIPIGEAPVAILLSFLPFFVLNRGDESIW